MKWMSRDNEMSEYTAIPAMQIKEKSWRNALDEKLLVEQTWCLNKNFDFFNLLMSQLCVNNVLIYSGR